MVSCGIWQFTCGSGDCIAGYDVCDGIPQCDDNSDESPENCPSKKNRAKQSLSFQYLDELGVTFLKTVSPRDMAIKASYFMLLALLAFLKFSRALKRQRNEFLWWNCFTCRFSTSFATFITGSYFILRAKGIQLVYKYGKWGTRKAQKFYAEIEELKEAQEYSIFTRAPFNIRRPHFNSVVIKEV